jgi:S-adenosylmethionine:tRNA ribosyltransferase-isomerase
MTDYLKDYDFDLPDSLIAKFPATPRDSSRLLEYKNQAISDLYFYDIVDRVPANTVFILNDSKVVKARLKFKIDGKDVEIFFISNKSNEFIHVLCSPGKLFKKDFCFTLPGGYSAIVSKVLEDGSRVIKVNGVSNLYSYLNTYGETPLPPYINAENPNSFHDSYQTVYAKNYGSVAAPTAGLHFTDSLMSKLKAKGCKFVYVTLNVGLGTFMPVRVDSIRDHKMHSECFNLSSESADLLNDYKEKNYEFVAVGTTSLRVLQSAYDYEKKLFICGESETDIFIYPGFNKFVIDALITNFHLPKSTLFMLVAAIVGIDKGKEIYNHAINKQYRFYSFGDASILWL